MGWQDNAAWNELYRQYRLQEQELVCAPKDGQKKTLNHRGELDRLIDAALYIAPESKISKEAATALYHEVITAAYRSLKSSVPAHLRITCSMGCS